MKCPNCGSTDINFETRTCRNCNHLIDAEGAAQLQAIEQASEQIAVAKTEEERRAAYETWEEKVFEVHDQGYRIITLIGFSNAGKTFLAHRLRFELADDWNVLPPPADVIPGTGMTIELTRLTSREATPRRRVLADCDGEAYKRIGEAAVQNRDINMTERRSVVIAALASAYILVLPAAELIDRKAYKGTGFLTQRFGAIVQLIMALQRIAGQAGGAREALQQGLKLDAVAEALQHEYRCEQPIHVLFAQADKLPAQQKYADDPHMFALTYAKTLYRTIESNFTNFRFDFVCAFDGHTEATELIEKIKQLDLQLEKAKLDPPDSANQSAEEIAEARQDLFDRAYEVDYDLPCYGTVAAFDWIDRMLEASPRARRRTTAAMKIRRRYDSLFKKLAARNPG
jgi:hypothetical protein